MAESLLFMPTTCRVRYLLLSLKIRQTGDSFPSPRGVSRHWRVEKSAAIKFVRGKFRGPRTAGWYTNRRPIVDTHLEVQTAFVRATFHSQFRERHITRRDSSGSGQIDFDTLKHMNLWVIAIEFYSETGGYFFSYIEKRADKKNNSIICRYNIFHI